MVFLTSKGRRHGKTCARPFLFVVLAILTLNLTGACGGKNFADIGPGIKKHGHYIEGVPFYMQSESTCGPAALAGILSFWGARVNMEHVIASVYIPELKGALPMDMERYAREAGFKTESYSGSLDQLKANIRKGKPVICLLDLGFSLYRRPHYVSVIGFDDENSVIIAHDGLKPDRLIGYKAFHKAWDRAGRWMLVIVPKSIETKYER